MSQVPLPPVVLVIDDNETNLALADAALAAEGMTTVLARSGQEGLDCMAQKPADCVLLDIRMPGMDGFETMRRLRALPGGKNVPVIFLTALRDLENFDRAIAAGADDFLTKPVSPSELVARVRAQLKLRTLSDDLHEHVNVVQKQRDDLLRMQLQKERLTNFVVHDLKSPVDAIDLHAQLLLRKKELDPETREAVRSIREQGKSLTRMFLNLLDISKAEEGQLTTRLAQANIDELVASVITEQSIRADAGCVSVVSDVETGLVADLDVDLIHRVLANLLENALRHSPRGSTIRIQARAVDGDLLLHVADNGPGIPADVRGHIFEKYVQAEAGVRAVTRSGRGLGLTYCRSAVEAHQGSIWVDDTDGVGATFSIRIPHAHR